LNASTTNKDPKDKSDDNLPMEVQPIFMVLDKLKLIEKKAGASIQGYYYGDSKKKSATSCTEIKDLYPNSADGFYHIKNDCSNDIII